MMAPSQPKIYHIVHMDRLASILNDGFLFCDRRITEGKNSGTTIGMGHIKKRRLSNPLRSHPGLCVGDCVPFYFCPRSVMLYVIHKGNHEDLGYADGQKPVIHLEADMHATVEWAQAHEKRWAFTTSNAGSSYYEDRNSLAQLNEINWAAVGARDWRQCREKKAAEFLVEEKFPWCLVERVGVHSTAAYNRVCSVLKQKSPRTRIEIMPGWYY